MSDALNKLAAQFAESNREEQKRLHQELMGLRHILSAIVLQAGGTYVLSNLCRLSTCPDDTLEFEVDDYNRCLKIRRIGKDTPKADADVPPIPCAPSLPDWML